MKKLLFIVVIVTVLMLSGCKTNENTNTSTETNANNPTSDSDNVMNITKSRAYSQDDGLLPIGSVILLTESTRKVMIIGVCQNEIMENGEKKLWDYSACIYPEGYMGPDQTYLFNNDQIEKIFSLGYQDEEQLEFKLKAEKVLEELRN